MVAFTVFLPNTSPISSIGTDASMPVFTVTIMLIEEAQVLAARLAPTGKAMRDVFESGEGAVALQVADNGATVNGLTVLSAYRVPTGKLCPDFNTVFTGIGAMM